MRLVLTAAVIVVFIMVVEIDVVAILVMILVLAIVEIGGVLVIEITLQLEKSNATIQLGRCSDYGNVVNSTFKSLFSIHYVTAVTSSLRLVVDHIASDTTTW